MSKLTKKGLFFPGGPGYRKYWLIGETSLQNNLTYTANFIFETVFFAFIVFVLIQLWRTVFSNGGMIAGYTLPQMIWYCIIAELAVFSGGNIFQELNNEIKGGNIAYTLNKPYNFIGYHLANGAGTIVFKLAVNTVIAVCLGLMFTGLLPDFKFVFLPLMALALLNGMLLNLLILACLGLTAFWMEENTAFFWIYQKLVFMLGLFLPIEFFPGGVQKWLRLLPFSYITYGPAKLGVDFSWDSFLWIVSMQLIYIIIFGAAAAIIYRKGALQINVNGG